MSKLDDFIRDLNLGSDGESRIDNHDLQTILLWLARSVKETMEEK